MAHFGGEIAHGSGGGFVDAPADHRLRGLRNQMRRGVYAGDGDASVGDDSVAVGPGCDGNAGQGIVDGSPQAQLLVGAAITGGGRRQQHPRNDLAELQAMTVIADVGVEILEREPARALGACDLELCVEAEQGGGGVRGERGPAFLAAGGDVAEIAVFLDAEAA